MIKAILFDLDGVLIKTEKETFKFYQKYLKSKGIFIKDSDFKYKAGRKSNDILTKEQQKKIDTQKLTQLKRELFNNQPKKYVKKVTGGKEILEYLKKNNFKLALVSQNESRMIENMVNWLEIKNYFDVILSIDDITNLKPDPEIYLLAAKKLNVMPSNCIVIEDSKDGIGSAKNAKMICIGLNHNYTPKNALLEADFIINDLKEINLDLIKKI